MKGQSRTWAVASAILLAIGGLAVASSRLRQAEIAAIESARQALSGAFGGSVVIGGPVEVHLFPRPQIVLSDIRLRDHAGTAVLDIALLKATLTLNSLWSGHIAFSRFQVIDVTGSIDADRFSLPPTTRLGALHDVMAKKIVVVSGVVAVRSVNPAASGILTDLNALIDGLDANGVASLSGRGVWHGQHAEISARIDPLFDFYEGLPASGWLKVHSSVLTASLTGVLHSGIRGGFDGVVSASTPSLSTMLRLGDVPLGFGQAVEHAAFSGRSVETEDGMAFSEARVVLNDTTFEGSLAWQDNHGRGALTGTFATDVLDLTPILDAFPDAHGKNGGWNGARLPLDPEHWRDIDLRVSANRAKFGSIEAEDCAFSALSRDGRLEVSLGEARSFDGLVKGRAVASLADTQLDVKLDVSVARISLDRLSSTLFGTDVTGSASGHFTGEARGDSVQALMQDLDGHGQVSVRQGRFPDLRTLGQIFYPDLDEASLRADLAAKPFDLATAEFRVDRGLVTTNAGNLVGPDLHVVFKGQASLPDHSFSLSSVAVPPEATGNKDTAAATNMVGTWGRPFHVMTLDKAAAAQWEPSAQPSTELLP